MKKEISEEDTAILTSELTGDYVTFTISSHIHGLGAASISPLAFVKLNEGRLNMLIENLIKCKTKMKKNK